MAPRLTVPGQLVNASVGRVHITRYLTTISLEAAKASQADYEAHCERVGTPRTPIIIISDQPLPLPSVEVRTYWRQAAVNSGFEAIGLVTSGVVGLMAATITHFAEQLVAVLGVRIRSFKNGDDAAQWLVTACDCGVDEFDIMDAVDAVQAVGGKRG